MKFSQRPYSAVSIATSFTRPQSAIDVELQRNPYSQKIVQTMQSSRSSSRVQSGKPRLSVYETDDARRLSVAELRRENQHYYNKELQSKPAIERAIQIKQQVQNLFDKQERVAKSAFNEKEVERVRQTLTESQNFAAGRDSYNFYQSRAKTQLQSSQVKESPYSDIAQQSIEQLQLSYMQDLIERQKPKLNIIHKPEIDANQKPAGMLTSQFETHYKGYKELGARDYVVRELDLMRQSINGIFSVQSKRALQESVAARSSSQFQQQDIIDECHNALEFLVDRLKAKRAANYKAKNAFAEARRSLLNAVLPLVNIYQKLLDDINKESQILACHQKSFNCIVDTANFVSKIDGKVGVWAQDAICESQKLFNRLKTDFQQDQQQTLEQSNVDVLNNRNLLKVSVELIDLERPGFQGQSSLLNYFQHALLDCYQKTHVNVVQQLKIREFKFNVPKIKQIERLQEMRKYGIVVLKIKQVIQKLRLKEKLTPAFKCQESNNKGQKLNLLQKLNYIGLNSYQYDIEKIAFLQLGKQPFQASGQYQISHQFNKMEDRLKFAFISLLSTAAEIKNIPVSAKELVELVHLYCQQFASKHIQGARLDELENQRQNDSKLEDYKKQLILRRDQLKQKISQTAIKIEEARDSYHPLVIDRSSQRIYNEQIRVLTHNDMYKKRNDIDFIRNFELFKSFMGYKVSDYESAEKLKLRYFEDRLEFIQTSVQAQLSKLNDFMTDIKSTRLLSVLTELEQYLDKWIRSFDRFSRQEQKRSIHVHEYRVFHRKHEVNQVTKQIQFADKIIDVQKQRMQFARLSGEIKAQKRVTVLNQSLDKRISLLSKKGQKEGFYD